MPAGRPASPAQADTGGTVLILGGSAKHRGGVETFCERAEAALDHYARDWTAQRLPTCSAYMSIGNLGDFIGAAIGFMRQPRPTLVWLQYTALPDLAYILLARLRRLPVLVTPHLGVNWRSQRSSHLRKLANRILRRATRFAFLSASQEHELTLPAEVPRSRIVTFFPRAALEDRLAPSDPAGPLRLIHSGRLSEGKGTFLFIDLLAALRTRNIAFEARVVGRADPATLAALERLIARHDLSDWVEVIPWLEEAELLDALRASDVLVHLSRIDSYPLIVLEALASATLPLVLDLPGASEIVARYDGMVVPADAPVAAAAQWLASLDKPAIRQRGDDAATKVRAEHGWKRCIETLELAFAATRG